MMNVSNNTLDPTTVTALPVLDPARLDAAAVRAAEEFLADGTPANTARSYASALRYWAVWHALRYGQPLEASAVSPAVVCQFIVDHLARFSRGAMRHELPPAIDARLVELRAKGKPGPLAYNTVAHRLAVLSRWHRLHADGASPTDDARVKTLMAKARRSQARHGLHVRKKTALVAEPLEAMLATCTDGLRGIRDRALLLVAWTGGGRRRSEVVALQVEDLHRIDAHTWTYALGSTKTDNSGVRREKPLGSEAVAALSQWLAAAGLTEGALFRRIHRNGHVGVAALTPDHVARMVKRRARLAGLQGDFGAHSLRSGFVTEAGRQNVPLGEVMAMTEHRSVGTVMGYFQAGTLLSSKATSLLASRPDSIRTEQPDASCTTDTDPSLP